MASRFLIPFGNRGLLGGDPFLDLHREVNRLFDDSFRDMASGSGRNRMLNPSIDLCSTDEGVEITAELPGVSEDDIDLRLDGDMLTISGEKRDERKDEKNRLVERSYGSFSRSIQLPFTPDSNKIEADCEKGVLRVKLPRSAEQDRSKRIAIGGRRDQQKSQAIDVEPTSNSGQPAMGRDWHSREEKEPAGGKRSDQRAGEKAPSGK
jgi:HSP20 family protein